VTSTIPNAFVEQTIAPSPPREILAEQIKLFYKNYAAGIYAQIPGEAIFAICLWWIGFGLPALIWLAVAVTFEVVDNWTAARVFRNFSTSVRDISRYSRRLCAGVGVSGLVWASAGFFISATNSPGQELWIVTALSLVMLAACTGCAGYLPAVYWWLTPVTLSLVFNLTFFSDLPFPGIYLAIGILFAAGAMLMFSHNFHRALTTSIQLNIRNRELAKETAAKKEDADKANRAKSGFLASASHDLRQPMQAIRLLVGNLYSTPQTPESRTLLNQIRDSVEAMGSQLDFLLDISRLDSGTVVPRYGEFSLERLFQRLKLQYGPLAQAKALSLEVTTAKVGVRSDPDLLERILQNLLSNAIRYTDAGHIELRCVQRDDCVHIEIADTGIGIPQSELATIFDVLKQLGNPERDHRKGTGLGLAIVDRLAKLLDHPVTVTSAEGRGSCFRVDVPIATALAPETPDVEPMSDTAVVGTFVLAIEDNPIILESLGRLLSNWGCPVVGARTGDAAIDALAEHDRIPDLIVSDYRLPNKETGIDAIANVRRAMDANVPAILITGDTDPAIADHAQRLGMQLLRKPVTPSELKRAMSLALAEGKKPLQH
jgi:two-component system, sensor histidine kinase